MFRRCLRSLSTFRSVKDSLLEKEGETINVRGLVKTIRKHKNVLFVEINDGSTVNNIQAVFEDHNLLE